MANEINQMLSVLMISYLSITRASACGWFLKVVVWKFTSNTSPYVPPYAGLAVVDTSAERCVFNSFD